MSVLFKALEKAAEANRVNRRPFDASLDILERSEQAERPVQAKKPTSHSSKPRNSKEAAHSVMWRALADAAAQTPSGRAAAAMERRIGPDGQLLHSATWHALAAAAAGRTPVLAQTQAAVRASHATGRSGHSATWRALAAAAQRTAAVRAMAAHSPTWQGLAAAAQKTAAAQAGAPSPAMARHEPPRPQPRPAQAPMRPQPAYVPPEPAAMPTGHVLRQHGMEGMKRLGELGARIRTSESFGRPSPRPFRLALISMVLVLGGSLGALYYFGEDAELIFEALFGEEQVRRVTTPRKPKQVAEAPKPVQPEAAKPDAGPEAKEPEPQVAAKQPEPQVAAKQPEPQVAAKQPEPQVAAKQSVPAAKPTPSPADAALDKVLADAARKPSLPREKEVAEKAATDLPSLMNEVKQRRAQGAVTPQIEVRKASGAPTSITTASPDSKIDIVRVRTSSAQSREDAEAAYTHLMSGRYEAASLLYAEVLKREPRNLAALTGRATALHKLGQYVEARILYEQALSISPGNREVLSNLMTIYGAEAPLEALRQLEGLQRDNPSFSPIPAQMASLYAQSGDLGSAIRYQGLAVQLAPENLLYRFNLAVMQDRAGMGPEAANSYETVLALASRGTGVQLPMPVTQVRERLTYLRTR
jgi:tetratricopeptide (TPR) repeat protein